MTQITTPMTLDYPARGGSIYPYFALAGGYARCRNDPSRRAIPISAHDLLQTPARGQRNTPGKSGTSASNASTTPTRGIPIT